MGEWPVMTKTRNEYLRKIQRDLEAISSTLDVETAARTRAAVHAAMSTSVIAAIGMYDARCRAVE
jgi:hypothetical protein